MNAPWETLYTFKTANFSIEWAVQIDYDIDLSFDETGETREKLESGEWQGFVSRVQVVHIPTGAVLGEDYLGGSIYARPMDFRTEHLGARGKWGSYFPDMVHCAVKEARKQVASMKTIQLRQAA